MELTLYQVDAFSGRPFSGNPAAVCPLESWLDTRLMQQIAQENNLSETAFFVPEGEEFGLRWFTPEMEVDLCGHATLASAYVLFEHLEPSLNKVIFSTRSGRLEVKQEDDLLVMDFPSRPPEVAAIEAGLVPALGVEPEIILKSRDYLVVYQSEQQVRELQPDFMRLSELDCLGVIVTAPGESVDFVSRFFAPGAGIPEDPVTGSAHCTLIPYWSERLDKTKLQARQLSARGGELFCEHHGDRVNIAGKAVLYLIGKIAV